MKNIFKTLLFVATVGFVFTACEPEENTVSTVSALPEVTVALSTDSQPVTTDETDAQTFTFDWILDENQINDITITIEQSPNSPATEDVDFTLSTHEISVPALTGQDTISFSITILPDFEVQEDDEDVVLLIGTSLPSGVQTQELTLVTITDVCAAPAAGTFEGSYEIESSLGGFGLPILLTEVVTLSSLDAATRSFPVTLYPGFGGFPDTFVISFAGCPGGSELFEFNTLDTGLACDGVNNIIFSQSTVTPTVDLTHDSSFTITVFEDEPIGCGVANDVTITFTKQ